jgi:hypothetical protein
MDDFCPLGLSAFSAVILARFLTGGNTFLLLKSLLPVS